MLDPHCYRPFFTHAKRLFDPHPPSGDFGFVELLTALALPESSSEFTPGPAGPGNRMITRHLELWLLERRCDSHSTIFLELAVCVAEQQRQQCRGRRRPVLGSSFQRHVRWRFWGILLISAKRGAAYPVASDLRSARRTVRKRLVPKNTFPSDMALK